VEGDSAATFAALDLGSNSFHLVIARQEAGGGWVIVDRLREMVRLAAGLDADNHLDAATRERALSCLRRLGQRLADLPADHVRVVGTNTLRKLRDHADFLAAAEAALNHRIEIVSGMEEARLIYLGVAHSRALAGQALVVDIGGGSTEFIVGADLEAQYKASLHLGCVSHSQTHFADGRLTADAFDSAELATRVELEPIERHFRGLGWASALGASGTIKAVGATLRESGWTDGTITPEGLDRLRASMISVGHLDALALPAVKPDRHAVFPGGVAILRAAFTGLGIDAMEVADGALREGILLDLPGRRAHADPRDASVERLARRFHADAEQAARVAATAAALFAAARAPWGLDEAMGWLLHWAARLHEIGLAISHSGYHKHGHYIIANSDLAGFAQDEQQRLALLVRAGRRKFPREHLAELDAATGAHLARLAVLLRLAVVLHRSRSDRPLAPPSLAVEGAHVWLDFPAGWLASQPLTRADLEAEQALLARGGFTLELTETAAPAQAEPAAAGSSGDSNRNPPADA